jgi:hypothetical protein
MSLYYDGHANLFKSVFLGKGKYLITVIGVTFFVSQISMITLYLIGSLEPQWFTIELILINMILPLVILMLMFSIALKFSGSPIRSQVFSEKLKLLQIAVIVWSLARMLRAAGGWFENKLFYGMILGLSDKEYDTFFIPMILIVFFLVIEIGPFMFVLDWHFMEIFIKKGFP